MYKMHVIDILAAFYICEKIVLENIVKIKNTLAYKRRFTVKHRFNSLVENYTKHNFDKNGYFDKILDYPTSQHN